MTRAHGSIALLALLLVALSAWLLASSRRPPESVPVPAPSAVPAPATDAAPAIPPAAPEASPPPAPEPSKPAPEAPLRVRTNVPGAEVTIWLRTKKEDGPTPLLESKADDHGVAEFALPVPRGDLERVSASATARGWTTARRSSAGEDIELRLEPGLEISGRVTFPDGRPVPGVQITAWPAGVSERTDEAGRYALAGLPEREMEIRSHEIGQARKAMAGTTGVDFVMEQHLVRVHIRDEEGRFVPDTFFDMKVLGTTGPGIWSQGTCTEERPLTVGAAAGMRIQFAFRREGYMNEVVERTIEGAPDIQDIDVVLKRPGPPGTIALRVSGDDDSTPASVLVSLLDSTGLGVAGHLRMKVDLVEGRGTLPGIPGGSYRARVFTARRGDAEDFGLPAEEAVVIEAGRECPLDVPIKSGGRLAVVVKDAQGKVVPAGGLELVDAGGTEMKIAFGNRTEGGMSFPPDRAEPAHGDEPLPPGGYRLRVVRSVGRERRVVAERDVVIQWRRTAEVEIVLAE